MKPRLAWIAVFVVAAAPLMMARLGSISGTVRDARGVPQLGAAIQVLEQPAAAPLVLYTDAHGRYRAANLAPGRYQVKASAAAFLPTLRQDLVLRSGANLVVNLTLNTLFEAVEMLPLRPRNSASQDDWKWTLRSMANRPILRVVDGSPVMVVSSDGVEGDRTLKARVEFLAGSPGEGLGTGDDRATRFAMQSSIFSAGTLAVNGGVGRSLDSPAVLRVSYQHQMGNGNRPQVSITARRLLIDTAERDRTELDAISVSASDLVRLTDFAELEYGSEYQTIQFLGRAAAFRPYGTLDIHLSPNTVVEYRYASSQPDVRAEKGFDSAPADLSESGPRLSVAGGAPLVESAHHQEISVSQRWGKNSFQVAGFSDRLDNAALPGVGDDEADDASGRILADPYSPTFAYFGGRLSTGGIRAVAERQISSALTGTLDVAYGGALALAGSSRLLTGPVPLEFAHRRLAAVAAKFSGRIACSHTQWIASYKWSPGADALTAVDAFNASAGQSEPFLGLFIRQPLPAPGFLPGKVEALVDIRNLLAQGYVPVIGQDGHTLYLVQSARSIRGGLAFNF